MAGSHYNTTHLTGKDLEKAIQAAVTQEERIMVLFNSTPGNSYTPCEVHSLIKSMSPITSIRRGITNLTNAGKLIKTSEQRLGIYGVLNYTWALPGYGHKSYAGRK